jgi:hypothetical protein
MLIFRLRPAGFAFTFRHADFGQNLAPRPAGVPACGNNGTP